MRTHAAYHNALRDPFGVNGPLERPTARVAARAATLAYPISTASRYLCATTRATPWENLAKENVRRPNGPNVRRTAGPLGRKCNGYGLRFPGRCPGLGDQRAFGPEARRREILPHRTGPIPVLDKRPGEAHDGFAQISLLNAVWNASRADEIGNLRRCGPTRKQRRRPRKSHLPAVPTTTLPVSMRGRVAALLQPEA
jgi:hypothetical protein